MKAIKPILDLWCLAYYRWALSEIDPMSPDVPDIVLRINDLERNAQ